MKDGRIVNLFIEGTENPFQNICDPFNRIFPYGLFLFSHFDKNTVESFFRIWHRDDIRNVSTGEAYEDYLKAQQTVRALWVRLMPSRRRPYQAAGRHR